ncbi:FtsK/SpoIIIE domain-containing protein [Mycolicibacterium moriokaense]|uniref:S-DNA-T family DNA segregation ATPase FtsK/SpoIIIE n=1 Tax=Mycolicibacterium moriokaense TaxID=39691 RepID=A0A318HHS5_9MYCO|nr:FtsK/SpoIIIE domain-containing protein [Mycolicibacterium moriokaense]PXX07250.1 S-DNA-T family DNA segregation ATPase FtsK/SpoIIIE [Mycolicibacterium moriokaense]
MASTSNPNPTNNSHNTGSDMGDTVIVIVVALAKAVAVLAWWSVLFPMISIPTLACVWLGLVCGPLFGLLLAVVSGLGLAAWSHLSPPSFQQWVTQPIRTRWRIWWVYRHRWTAICALHSLTAKLDDRTLVPALRSVTLGATSDVAEVAILTGQSVADWQNKSAALAEALRARRVTIRSIKPGTIAITAHHGDALATPIRLPRPAPDTTVDPSTLRVGVTDAGTWWRLPVLGQHILVAGATGAGKGSVLWSIIAALAPGVSAGWVRLLVIDPKGGMEFGRGHRLFAGFAHDNAETTLALLRAATTVMAQRAQRLRGHTRLLTPTTAEPLIVLIVDEIASLTAYIGDRKTRAEAEQLLGLLLAQGRAVGVSVIAAVQDPSKDVLPIRQLFSIRVGLRMTESTQTSMVLGVAARDAGAVCDQIPTSTPGLGYVCADGTSEPVRVRAFHVTDPDIDYLATHFPPNTQSGGTSHTDNSQP